MKITEADDLFLKLESNQITAQKEIEKQNMMIGTMRKIPGLKLWELNIETKTISEPKMEAVMLMNGEVRKKLQIGKHCLYVQALNYKNAKRKLLNMLQKMVSK